MGPRCPDRQAIARLREQQRLRHLSTRAREFLGRTASATREEMDRVDVLLVADTGGHLLELAALREVWAQRARMWVTIDHSDARGLLRSERVVFAHGPTCRSCSSLVKNAWLAWRVIGTVRPRVLLATGSGVPVPFAWVGRLRGVFIIYVECGGRVDRPSMSCRLIEPVAHRLYVQWPELLPRLRKARYAGRMPLPRLEEFVPSSPPTANMASELEVFAMVGSSIRYPFDRLIRALGELPLTEGIVAQRGISRLKPENVVSFDFMPLTQLINGIRSAKAVVTHAGIGSIMLALAAGRHPIVIPRLHRLNEAVDDHQLRFAQRLAELQLVTLVEDESELARVFVDAVGGGRGRRSARLERGLAESVDLELAGSLLRNSKEHASRPHPSSSACGSKR
jgi:UDP-N-acetylglucosamine transferase subunit ALG13